MFYKLRTWVLGTILWDLFTWVLPFKYSSKGIGIQFDRGERKTIEPKSYNMVHSHFGLQNHMAILLTRVYLNLVFLLPYLRHQKIGYDLNKNYPCNHGGLMALCFYLTCLCLKRVHFCLEKKFELTFSPRKYTIWQVWFMDNFWMFWFTPFKINWGQKRHRG